MGLRNPLLPVAQKARDEIAKENHGYVSVTQIRARMMQKPWDLMKVFAMDVAMQRMIRLAISESLRGWPAEKLLGGRSFRHVSTEREHTVEELERMVSVSDYLLQPRIDGNKKLHDKLVAAREMQTTEADPRNTVVEDATAQAEVRE